MTLKVIRYKNYGCTINSGKGESVYFTNFYWSFYELNNGEIIDLNLEENLTNEKVTSIHYHFDYSKYKLKSGEFFEYKFGNAKPDTQEIIDEFFDWFESIPPTTDIKKLRTVSQDEEKYIKEFFIKNILDTKGVPTNIIYE